MWRQATMIWLLRKHPLKNPKLTHTLILILTLSTSARDLCDGVELSGGSFVRCTSTSSLDDICQANKRSELTWWVVLYCFVYTLSICRTHSLSHHCLSTSSVVEPNSSPAAQSNTKTCSREYQTQRHPLLSSLYASEFTVCSAAATVFVCASGEAPRFCDCTAFCNSASKKKSQTSCLSSYDRTAMSSWHYLCI